MPTKTKTEYETVEKNITYIECDVPGCFHTDEKYEVIELAVNPKYDYEEYKEPTVIQQVDSQMKAQEWVDKRKPHLNKIGSTENFHDEVSYAYGYKRKQKGTNARADASFFVCASCLKNHFEVVPDRYEPKNVNNIEGRKGGLYIEEDTYPKFEINIGRWKLLAVCIIQFIIIMSYLLI